METIQHTMHITKQPVFTIFLDAKSCFDRILFESVIREAYLAGTQDQGLLLIKNRLMNRKTFCEYDKVIMGPIDDQLGVEQGGQNSDKFFRLVGNYQLKSAQNSSLGVQIAPDLNIAAIGQADDSCLMSTSIHSLHSLVNLTLEYCRKFHVELVPDKTKLMVFYPSSQSFNAYYSKLISNINIDGTKIEFSDSAEHVGIIRHTSGNLPHILNRLSSHTRAINAVLPAGLARGHSGNPAAAIRVEKIYGAPVLLSGLASLVLNNSEVETINIHYKGCLEGLMKLYKKTPACVVFFLAGSLPAPALLHLNMFSLFNMIIRLADSPLALLARHCLTATPPPNKSWFKQIDNLCHTYGLPSALSFLNLPPTKSEMKQMVKKKIINFWEKKLRNDSLDLPSLQFFHPNFLSLSSPHPLWTTAGSSPYEVKKAVVQARMLSGRYRTERLRRHWSSNSEGYCLLPSCHQQFDDLTHILLACPALQEARDRMEQLWTDHLNDIPHINTVVRDYMSQPDHYKVQLLLDPSVLPKVISLRQEHGDTVLNSIFYLTRTFCYSLHNSRLKMLGII